MMDSDASGHAEDGTPCDTKHNEYAGFTLESNHEIGRIPLSTLNPQTLYKDFVASRRAVVIDGCLNSTDLFEGAKWSNSYLQDKAGGAQIKVEWRERSNNHFGQGREKSMVFSDFLREQERGNDLLYLTTQELDVDSSGRPELMSAPLDTLKDDFPLRPALMGALIPQNVNLWMGYCRGEGSKSGLHHDFHDNLYILLRGKKIFRLFSPADAHRMYTEGEIVKVHPNGRINYTGHETRADGADILAETAALAADLVDEAAMEAEVVAAQTAVERGEQGAGDRLAEAERKLEDALEAVLNTECAGEDASGSEGGDASYDEGPGFFDGINDDPTEQEFEDAERKTSVKRRRTDPIMSDDSDSQEIDAKRGDNGRRHDISAERRLHDEGDGRGLDDAVGGVDGNGRLRNSTEVHVAKAADEDSSVKEVRSGSKRPSNFSRVDPSLSRQELQDKFPLFLEARECSVEVKAGQMLYLPAGWFHEVTSFASDEGGHMAFNYWFHPPDAGVGSDIAAPYMSRFWQRDWEQREL